MDELHSPPRVPGSEYTLPAEVKAIQHPIDVHFLKKGEGSDKVTSPKTEGRDNVTPYIQVEGGSSSTTFNNATGASHLKTSDDATSLTSASNTSLCEIRTTNRKFNTTE
jgi:hypothetical protein